MPRPKRLPPGLILRGKTYWANFCHRGERIRKPLSRNARAAEEMLTELRARLNRGDFGLLDDDYSVEELRTQYLAYARQRNKPGTVTRYEYNLAAILPEMPPRVHMISLDAVIRYREKRLAGGASPRTVNSDVQTLGRMLRWGVKHGLIGSNPIGAIEPIPHDHPKEGRALEKDEVDRLLEASPQPSRDVWYAYLVTGLRRRELAELLFSDIDWDTRELKVRRGVAKNHNMRRIPIEPGLWEIICRQFDARTEREPASGARSKAARQFTRNHIFVTTINTPLTYGGGLYRLFIRCCKLAGIQTRRLDAEGREIDHVDIHSLRRTFATDLIENRADPKTVQELLGHATLAMTMGLYAKVRSGSKRAAVGRLSYGAAASDPAAHKGAESDSPEPDFEPSEPGDETADLG